jgi:hypothetical protein
MRRCFMPPDLRCPREDPLKSTGSGSVLEAACPNCGAEIEFMGDEKRRKCSKCGEFMSNPRLSSDGPE